MGTQDTGARVRALRQCCRGPTKAWGGLAAREGESGAQAAVHSAARPGAAPRVCIYPCPSASGRYLSPSSWMLPGDNAVWAGGWGGDRCPVTVEFQINNE